MTPLRVTLVTLGDPQALTGGYLYHRRMAQAATANDAALSFVSFPDRRFPLPALAGPTIGGRIREQRPHVVALDSIVAGFAAPWLRRFPAPLAAIIHQSPGGIGHGSIRSVVQRKLDLITYRRCDRVMVASETLIDEVVTHGIELKRIVLVAPGRDVAETKTAALDLRRGRESASLCVANWSEHKGIVELLHAFAQVPEPLCTLHLVGGEGVDPRYAARVRELLARGDLAERVVRHGPVPSDEVGAMYRAADMFVLPSMSEAYGTVYGEAMAAGLPVVGWNLGNLAHLAKHGCDGFLLEPGDLAGLAAAMAKLSADTELRNQMSHSARERAASFTTWDESGALFFSVLRALGKATKR
ncbi:MAG: glycosyltransferase family 4 protein [Actinomycetota bacterium]